MNESSNGTFLQLYYKLNSEAPVGTYWIEVWNEDNNVKFSQSFKVEKYGTFCSSPNLDLCVVLPDMRITNCHILPLVLPKFDMKVKAPKEMSVAQEDITVEVCST